MPRAQGEPPADHDGSNGCYDFNSCLGNVIARMKQADVSQIPVVGERGELGVGGELGRQRLDFQRPLRGLVGAAVSTGVEQADGLAQGALCGALTPLQPPGAGSLGQADQAVQGTHRDIAQRTRDNDAQQEQVERQVDPPWRPVDRDDAVVVAQRAGGQRGKGRPCAQLRRRHQIDRAEAPGIIEHQLLPPFGLHHQMPVHSGEEARRRIELITAEVEVGQVYEGTVLKLLDIGAIVSLLPGKDGLVHISQIAHQRVNNVADHLKEGQQVRVKVLEVDERGRVRLSMKALLDTPAKEEAAAPAEQQ